MNRNVLIVGATSAIAESAARLYAGAGDRLYLVARNRERLDAIAEDLRIRGAAAVVTEVLDLNDLPSHEPMLERALQAGGIDVLLVAHGILPDQQQCERDWQETLETLNTNCLSVISILTHAANRMARRGRGTIAVISSVAGDRGRRSNYVYGTSKAAVSVFLQGLRSRLHPAGVHVLTVKPGFVDTPMTKAFSKGLLWASPHAVARDIYRAIEMKRDVAYVPWFWRYIMFVVDMVPERIFKTMKL